MVRAIFGVLREAWQIFSARGARFLGAAIAFYSLLSIAPLFLVVLVVIGRFFGRARAEDALFSGLGVWIAPEGIEVVKKLTRDLDAHSGHGIVGGALVLYGSTRLFRALHRALNALWGIDVAEHDRETRTIVKLFKRYGVALLLTALVTGLVLAMLVLKLGLAVIGQWGVVDIPIVYRALEFAGSVALSFVLFASLYALLPATQVGARNVVWGAALSTALFAIGSAGVSAYLKHKALGDLYEGAGALVLAVLWVYYSAQVFFFGAAVTASLSGRGVR